MTASGHGTLTQCLSQEGYDDSEWTRYSNTQCLSQEGYDDSEWTWYGTLTHTVCLRRGTMTVSGHGTVR